MLDATNNPVGLVYVYATVVGENVKTVRCPCLYHSGLYISEQSGNQ